MIIDNKLLTLNQIDKVLEKYWEEEKIMGLEGEGGCKVIWLAKFIIQVF